MSANFSRKFVTADSLDHPIYKDGPFQWEAYVWFFVHDTTDNSEYIFSSDIFEIVMGS